jgi:hypothetical protein
LLSEWQIAVGMKEFRMRRTIVLMSPVLIGLVAGASSTASAQQTCLAEVDRLANSLGMTGQASPQATVPRSGASSESLAQSGGVIKPPDVGSARVMEPPSGAADGMKTAPAIPQQEGAPEGSVPGGGTTQRGTGRSTLGAAERAQLESLLLSARNAGRQGDAAQCEERLEEARDLARESGADSRM